MSSASNGGLRLLAERILFNRDAPPVLHLAAWKLIYRGETRPLRDLVEEAGLERI